MGMKKSQPTSSGQVRPADDTDETQVKQLIAEYKRGNQHAFDEIVRQYRNQVAALAYKMVNDYDEAADITQNVFVKMSKNVWRYDESKKFYTWLYRITVNASIDYIRKHKRHRHEPLEDYHEKSDASTNSPEFNYRRHQFHGYLKQATQRLNDKQRSAFVLRDIDGCKIDEVAHIMDMPEATVRWYLHRARSRIRRELMRRCPQLLVVFGIK
jgi:RNA polymerase sigma-70 factor (ECF subfamily)